ncbi:glutamate--tRNA ligase [Arenibacter latericius]|uniref:glutamate--tRNA ligase n=1 Tax=Arenibacter latericius TaxID=86104 RepID=UPI0004065A6F|nr:glutamate--tRNA ligase [Arenibacter latericius]
MTKRVRVRFAPSPTGPLHIGGVRTALFNYLFAKKHNGDFILRIEDTDQKRFVKGAEEYIIDSLNWCKMPYDEGPGKDGGHGPYRQSERKELYRKYADILLEKGAAYYAFDTSEELDAHRKDHEAKGKTFIYNHHNRLKLTNSLVLSEEETNKRITAGDEFVIRFKSPTDTKIHLNDLVRGKMEIDSNVLDDKVLFKSDGMPTYHLANIVDDHLMDISHVIRGEEWLPSLALHQLLYEAFGWDVPQFAHLPLIMKPVGKGKLSKRDGEKLGFPVFPLTWNESIGYKESGYFPEAVVNFLALLGWNPGTEQEIFSLEELVTTFDISRVNKSGARFDPDKTKWYNHHYMQQHSNKELAKDFTTILQNKEAHISEERLVLPYVEEVVALIKERATFIQDFWELANFFFVAPDSYNEKAVKKQWKEDTPSIMKQLVSLLETISDFTAQNVETKVKEWIGEQGLAFGKVMPPLRLITVGDMKGPDMFKILELIGKEDSIERIKKAIAVL